jgi:hypothetical protein
VSLSTPRLCLDTVPIRSRWSLLDCFSRVHHLMPKLEKVLVDRLTLRLEVREEACVLLRAVHSKTRPGTGYDIGEAKACLPVIYSYIASKAYVLILPYIYICVCFFFSSVDLWTWISLGYADITEEVTQKAPCLTRKTFASTLKIVKTAMLASKKQRPRLDRLRHAHQRAQAEIGQPLRVKSWMKEAQAALAAFSRFRQDFASYLRDLVQKYESPCSFGSIGRSRCVTRKRRPAHPACASPARPYSTSSWWTSTARRSRSSLAL